MFLSAILGLVVNVIGIPPAGKVIRSNSWTTIFVHVLFAILYAFMMLLQPRMKERLLLRLIVDDLPTE